MGAFADLLGQAQKFGAHEITFRVRLEGAPSPDGHRPWTATALLDPKVPNLAMGRTGEEALRELVAFLERTAG